MTRFGLRKKLKDGLKTALGRGKSSDGESAGTFTVTFVMPDGTEREGEAEPRYTLVMASQTLDTPIATNCPDGGCGECVVDVVAGADALAPPSAAESRAFEHGQKRAISDRERLGCHARVMGPGARIKIRRTWRIEDQT